MNLPMTTDDKWANDMLKEEFKLKNKIEKLKNKIEKLKIHIKKMKEHKERTRIRHKNRLIRHIRETNQTIARLKRNSRREYALRRIALHEKDWTQDFWDAVSEWRNSSKEMSLEDLREYAESIGIQDADEWDFSERDHIAIGFGTQIGEEE